jgi:hypothetical protein
MMRELLRRNASSAAQLARNGSLIVGQPLYLLFLVLGETVLIRTRVCTSARFLFVLFYSSLEADARLLSLLLLFCFVFTEHDLRRCSGL